MLSLALCSLFVINGIWLLRGSVLTSLTVTVYNFLYFRFIGELFLVQILTSKVMHQCLHSLQKAGDEASLESFCKLWTTIGKAFDANAQARVSTVQCACIVYIIVIYICH